ncbi:MFS general substrate transporter [Glarea lozoyensis ATCC 20868]|uniref:MFS general substrate transporter n=1 Tax=Glarea lozoyensis (strain ATCC 20868 / MF5171) TaxID=1116229 RepID=S3D9F5_GLAL2|nr:MFS general substrate transporter [Glarea lozoyensis ATCC 20868]EPE33744.1 MFS general substrate transporter [Glarea lozoyensis ATCC 20868]
MAPAVSNNSEHESTTQQSETPATQARSENAETQSEEDGGEYAPRRNMIPIMIALCVASFLAILDISFVTTALPTIAEHFKASQISYSWVGSSYLLTQSALAPLWGKVSDIFGRKPIVLLATFVFFLGSLICAVANTVAVLIAGRAIQGAGAGGVLLIVTILIGDLVSPRQRGLYFGILGGVYAIAISSGPLIGGVIAENIGWRWCFYINLPFQGIAFALLVFFLHVHDPRTEIIKGLMAVDWLGSLTLTASVLMLLLGLQYGGEVHPWDSAIVLCLIIFGVLVCAIFVGIEWKFARYPVLPLRLFTTVPIVALFVVDLTHGFLLYGTAYFVPFYFQVVLRASPTNSAVWSLPLAIPLALFTIGTGLYMRQTGKYLYMIIGGMILSTLGTGLLIDLGAETNWPKIIIYQLIIAVGLGPNFQAPTIALQARFPPADGGVAVSAASAIRALSAAFSIVLGGVILENRLSAKGGRLIAAGISSTMADAIAKNGAAGSVELVSQLTPAQQHIFRLAVKDSLADMWIFFVILSAIGLIASFLVGSDELSDEHVEHKTGLEVEEANRLVHEKPRGSEPELAEMT